MSLSPSEIEGFIRDGFVRVDEAFPRRLADDGRAILWRATGCDPDDPSTWTQPVIRLGGFSDPPFAEAVNAPKLRAAYDQLVGPGRWAPRDSLGTFPIRFPSPDDPGDAGWHVDASFAGDDPDDFMTYRVNLRSRGRALLMLFLFSDVGDDDAPTRIRIGSHRTVARILEPAAEAGLSMMELAGRLDATEDAPIALATGAAGTVYLCHPLLAHAAQPHRGAAPRFMAQPPLLPATPIDLDKGGPGPPVEQAIREAIGLF